MGKRLWAATIKQIIIGLAIIFCIGVMYDHFFDEYDHSPILSGFVAIAIYLFMSVVFVVVNGVSGAIYLWMFAGNDFSGGVLDDLRNLKMPPPRTYDPKNFEYLAIIAGDEGVTASDRVKAASLHGVYTTLMSKGIFRSLAMQKAIDDAILRYSQEAPQTGS